MQTIATTPVDALRAELRRVAAGRLVPRLWHQLRHEWQRSADRSVARAVWASDHPGVADEISTASRGKG